MLSAGVRELLAWLEGEPDAELGADLAALAGRVPACVSPTLSEAERGALLPAAAARAFDIAERFRARLLAAKLPLPAALFDLAASLQGVLLDLARAYAQPNRTGIVSLAARTDALALVAEAWMLAAMAATPVPAGLWQLAHAVALSDEALVRSPGLRQAYLRMLALTVAQPEGLTARELDWLAAFVTPALLEAAILRQAGGAAQDSPWFIDDAADHPPRELARHGVPAGEGAGLWGFDPRPLLAQLDQQTELLSSCVAATPLTAEAAGFPPGLTAPEMLAQLRRLRSYWNSPLLRQGQRSAQHYEVDVVVGLKALWELGRDGTPKVAAAASAWRVVNESADGFALESGAGAAGGIEPGGVLALRRGAGQPWLVCVVRRARSTRTGQLALGVQRIGVGFASVRAVFGTADVHPVPALQLAAATPQGEHAALLVPADSYAPGPFTLLPLDAAAAPVQAQALGIVLRTAALDLLHFHPDRAAA